MNEPSVEYGSDKPSRLERELQELRKETKHIMTTAEEVKTAIAALTTDLEADAAAAQAEFLKLEQEVTEGKPVTQENLAPLKEAIEALDGRVRAADSDIPTT
jgi:predicted  nucleic acid-binding Zn-ribbon protein